MGFFFNEAKTEASVKKVTKPKTGRRADIPIDSLRQLGCSVCPRDSDKSLNHPKITPTGVKRPTVYILGTNPNYDDDEAGSHWNGKMGAEIISKFGRNFMRDEVRSGYIAQCKGDDLTIESQCCYNRVVSDIEQAKPLVVVGIGDAVLQWATGVSSTAMVSRGNMFPVKIGNHTCWFFSLLFPNYIAKKSYKISEFELTFAHDVAKLKDWLENPKQVKVWEAPYDRGVEIITGQEPGDMQLLEEALHSLLYERKSAVDYETNGLRPWMMKDPHIWTAAVGTFKRTIAFPVDHPEGWGSESRMARVRGLLRDYILESGRKAAHNLSFELEWTNYFFGEECLRRTEWDDTMAIGHTLDERPGVKSLGYQTLITFGFDIKKQSNIDTKRILEYPLKNVLRYNGMDTKWTDGLRDARMPEIIANPKFLLEYERKVRLAPTLVLTEAKGMDVDFKYAQKQLDHLNTTATKLEGQIARCPEVKQFSTQFGTFSPTNSDHVLKLMKEVCERDEVKVIDQRTGTIRWTSDEEALNKIPAKEVPSAGLILEHRGVAKLRSTYVQPIIDRKIVCPDGKVRPKYGSMHAVTGRLNAEDPNVQNWPSRKFKEIRGIICSSPGGFLEAHDYGQIEFRVVGMASEDPEIVKACWTGYDVHKFWAERLVKIYPASIDWIVDEFKIDWDEKGLKTLRQEMKNKWVFPQLFGASINSCAEQLHLPDYVASDLGEEFWDTFKATKKWQDKLLTSYEKNLYVETLSGRRRRGPMTKNEIINMPIQGTAADIVLAGMCALSERAYMDEDPELQPILNVHDDLTNDIADENTHKMDIIAYEMCKHRFDYINVPLVVEVKVGYQWHNLEEVKVYRSDEIFNLRNPYA